MARIMMLTHSYYLRDPRVRREAETLASVGHEVDVLCLRLPGEAQTVSVNGVHVRRIPLTHERGSFLRYCFEYLLSPVFAFCVLAIRMVAGKRYDLIQVHTPPDFLVFSTLVSRLFGSKVLLDLHDPMPETLSNKYGGKPHPLLEKIVLLQERLALRFSDFVITVTAQVRDVLLARNTTSKNLDVIMNFADPKYFQGLHSGSQLLVESQPNEVAPTLVFMGTLSRRYGVDLAIRALPLLQEKLPDIRLKIIGDGEERPNLERLAISLEVDSNVRFKGLVPIDGIPGTALPAHVGLAPHRRDTLYDMCFPSKIYDYLALGLPVVACRTESLDYYFGRDNVILFFESESVEQLADRIYQILSNPKLGEQLKERASDFLEAHNWHRERKRYIRIVESLTKSLSSPE